jgi:tetratricopeptide (TPR) repeat protein
LTSPAKIRANRRNAVRSTGPRTAVGKAQSKRNAFRHGLSIPRIFDDSFAVQVEELTDRFAELSGGPRQIARWAAEAQLEVRRVREAKVDTINRHVRQRIKDADDDLSEEARISSALAEIMPILPIFDRYDRRALSQRKKALLTLEGEGTNIPSQESALARRKSSAAVRPSTDTRTAGMPLELQLDRAVSAILFRIDKCKISIVMDSINSKGPARRSRRYEALRQAIAAAARVVRRYIIMGCPIEALGQVERMLTFAPDSLLLHAVRACALLIIEHPDAPELLLRHHGRIVDGTCWETVVLEQLRLLRKAPHVPEQLARDVERLFNAVPPRTDANDAATIVDKSRSSTQSSNLKTGDELVELGLHEEALVVYFRELSIYNGKVKFGGAIIGLYAYGERMELPQKIRNVALHFLCCREFERALNTIDRALPAFPKDAKLNILRAHALMLLGRIEEARALYEEFRSARASAKQFGIDIAIDDFQTMRSAELTHPLMDEIEKSR